MIEKELREFLLSKGVSDVGFSYIDNADTGELKYAVSIVVRLSDAIVDEITDEPTPTYFNHYRRKKWLGKIKRIPSRMDIIKCYRTYCRTRTKSGL